MLAGSRPPARQRSRSAATGTCAGFRLEKPFDLGIDTDRQQRHWLTATPGVLTMAYPARQQWGAMFITAGRPSPPGHRQSIDLSSRLPFPVYTDGADPGNHYVPSGYIGDYSAVAMNQFWAGHPHHGKTCIQVTYRGAVPGGKE